MSRKINNGENVSNRQWLRRQNYPYVFIWILYYAWVIVFATFWTAIPGSDSVLNTSVRSLMHSTNLISSAIFVLILKKQWYVISARTGSIIVICGFIGFYLISPLPLKIIMALFTSIGLGLVNASIIIPFVFVLNNTEKFYAVVGSNFMIGILLFLLRILSKTGGVLTEVILAFSLLIISLSFLWGFKKEALYHEIEIIPHNKKVPTGAWLILVFSCLFAIFGKGVGTGLLDLVSSNSELTYLYYAIGIIIGSIVYYLVYRYFAQSTSIIWNLAFATLAVSLLINNLIVNPNAALLFGLMFGISTSFGMINMYYLLGVISKKYQSMLYLRLSILLIGALSGVSGVIIGNAITGYKESIVIMTALITGIIVIVILTLSPFLATLHYGADWIDDAGLKEINAAKSTLLDGYDFSPREKEVCALLLQGYTLRQISGILKLGYPTVNTYYTAIYRKLNINSRSELYHLFSSPH